MIPDRPATGPLDELRRLLDDADFSEAAVCRRLDLPDIYAFQPRGLEPEADDLLDLLIILFLDGVTVSTEAFEDLVSENARAALGELGLLSAPDDGRLHATVSLYPTAGLHLVSDRPVDPLTGEDRVLPADAVYPAVTTASRDFVSSLPPSPSGRVLELCSGTGIAALLAARTADHAWAVDITERSTRFARFNAALNGLDNVTVLQGDLWEPVERLEFETVLAHPPYVPSEEIRTIYRDGGRDGEQVTRGILAGLGRHLAPGGRFHCTCMLTEREGAPLEERIPAMLGDAADDFDLLLMPIKTVDPYRALFDEAILGGSTLDQVRQREASYKELGIRSLVYGSFALHRRTEPGTPRSLRRPRGPKTDGAAIRWLLDWETTPAGMSPDELADATPSASEHIEAGSDLALDNGQWHPVKMSVRTSQPFPSSVQCAPWVLELLARCDGRRTVRELLDGLRRDGLLAAEAPDDKLLELIGSLVSASFLTVPNHPLPEPPPNDVR